MESSKVDMFMTNSNFRNTSAANGDMLQMDDSKWGLSSNNAI
jgi:hypothetical protein